MKYILFLLCIYFLFRFAHILSIPIFNDEAIYLDWGFREVNNESMLFFSLFDGKQPLLMWIFGAIQLLPIDPLWGARAVSVITGSFTLLGIFTLGKKYFSQQTAFFAGLLYIFTPLFSFFDRQALMESSIAAVGIWSLYFTFELFEKKDNKSAYILGSLLGIGFFIKSSSLLFFISFLILWCRVVLTQHSDKKVCLGTLVRVLISFFLVITPLMLQTEFLLIFTKNDRFTLSMGELIRAPIFHWLTNAWSSAEILFWHFGPWWLLAGISLITQYRRRPYLVVWFLSGIVLFLLTIRTPSPRYFVVFLPLLCLFVIDGTELLFLQKKVHQTALLTAIFSLAFFTSFLQVFFPLHYFQILSSRTRFSQIDGYVIDWPSGYGIKEATNYLNNATKEKPIEVWSLGDWGNPENGVLTFLRQNNQVSIYPYQPHRLEQFYAKSDLSRHRSVYIVTRDELHGLKGNVKLEAVFSKPLSIHSVQIYSIIEQCKM